jgi:transcriptional regulator with XRE-family HTH domain
LILITSSQIKAARAMTGLTVRALAEQSNIAFSTLVRLESSGNAIPAGNIETLRKLIETFQAAGIEFIGTPENGAGVRWLPK